MQGELDLYGVRARLRPALLVALPLAVAVAAVEPSTSSGWGVVWGVIAYSGGAFLLAQFGRDAGRAKQRRLFAKWDGSPTTKQLRHSDAPNGVALARYHARLEALLPDLRLPTQEQEAVDPAAADVKYEAAALYLRARTRDAKRFPLVFEENCNYGFRRNLWGMKPIGLFSTIVGLAVVCGLVASHVCYETPILWSAVLAAGLVNMAFLFAWIFWIRPDWVRSVAEAYASQLLETIDTLEADQKT